MEEQDVRSESISRVTRSRAVARRSYNRLSRWYDMLAASERRFAAAGVACLAPQQGESILEIGHGTGWTLIDLARAVGAAGRVYGLDISTGMQAVAARRLRAAGLSACIELTTGDACALPFRSGCMNAIFMSFTLELFDTPEIPLVLNGCRRVLSDAGRVCVVALAAQQRPGLALRLYQGAHERFPQLVDCRPIDAPEALRAAQFRVRSASRSQTWGLPLDICLAAK